MSLYAILCHFSPFYVTFPLSSFCFSYVHFPLLPSLFPSSSPFNPLTHPLQTTAVDNEVEVPESSVPAEALFPAMFKGRGTRGHRFHVHDRAKYFGPKPTTEKKTETKAKVEAPKEVPKAEIPKQVVKETPKEVVKETPKEVVKEAPKAETPKVETPKAEIPKIETPEIAETPKEDPKVEAPKIAEEEKPKVEARKAAPKHDEM